MPTVERELEGTWEEILSHSEDLSGHWVYVRVFPTGTVPADSSARRTRRFTIRDLMRMSDSDRRMAMAEIASKAERVYANHPELLEFQAFGDKDLYDETPSR